MKLKNVFLIFIFFILSANIVTAQKKNKKIIVTGYVFDGANRPVSDAIILVDNKKSSGVTDINGFYQIQVKPKTELIAVFAKPNFFIEKQFEGQAIINFLFMDTIVAVEPILNDEYFRKITKSVYVENDSKNNVVAVSNSDVIKILGDEHLTYNSIYEMIESKVPGVSVDANRKKITVRGVNRMGYADNAPVFVVDGMPINTIDHVSPDMVESITFLKGTASTIYGSRAVNGAIVIALKKR